jgi:hypothetical protein
MNKNLSGMPSVRLHSEEQCIQLGTSNDDHLKELRGQDLTLGHFSSHLRLASWQLCLAKLQPNQGNVWGEIIELSRDHRFPSLASLIHISNSSSGSSMDRVKWTSWRVGGSVVYKFVVA